ncbi:S8 family serine peptidase [Streptomyces glaucescens]|uniref:S8 family serine peptidase n=1 Tax=Streptomyces glaucescens TaxID=1907 RepID=UPI000D19EBB6|nr:S8 family serine peptidase [Streptomyces glaucescens]
MAKIKVLLEIEPPPAAERDGFGAFREAAASETSAFDQGLPGLDLVAGLGVEPGESFVPVPMFSAPREGEGGTQGPLRALVEFAVPETNADMAPTSMVLPVEVSPTKLVELRERDGVVVWPSSPLHLYEKEEPGPGEPGADVQAHAFDLARSVTGLDCRPFRAGVTIDAVRALLGVTRPWQDGFRGQNIVVGVLDEGVNGQVYPVAGGFAQPGADLQPGAAPITSHGSMCAADILVAAPAARLYDYPFLGRPDSGGALTMFQAVLEHRRLDGTPHLTNNSYGFVGVPRRDQAPGHEIWDLDHPLHRKVREVVTSGAAAFFAAGNCGVQCPSGDCRRSGIGPGRSVHASNSLTEVITVAAVNSRGERVGYSSQGPGMFDEKKPDFAAYTHFFGNFGPGRPGGVPLPPRSPFDNGTSAATPVAAGVAALLLSAFPELTPEGLREALLAGLVNPTGKVWDAGYGRGIVNAAASYSFLLRKA